jgi:hypothetical protein
MDAEGAEPLVFHGMHRAGAKRPHQDHGRVVSRENPAFRPRPRPSDPRDGIPDSNLWVQKGGATASD